MRLLNYFFFRHSALYLQKDEIWNFCAVELFYLMMLKDKYENSISFLCTFDMCGILYIAKLFVCDVSTSSSVVYTLTA